MLVVRCEVGDLWESECNGQSCMHVLCFVLLASSRLVAQGNGRFLKLYM